MTIPAELEYQGPNANLVREVFDLAFSQRIVGSVGPDYRDDAVVVTTDMVRGVDAAGMASDEGRFEVAFGDEMLTPENWPYDGDVSWSDEEGWSGLRENLTTHYIKTESWYDWSADHEQELRKCKSLAVQWTADDPMHLHKHLRAVLPVGPTGPDGSEGYYQAYMVNEIASDLMQCAINRAFNGLTDNFWERLLGVYQQGLWPCCWLGRWPAERRFLAWRRAE